MKKNAWSPVALAIGLSLAASEPKPVPTQNAPSQPPKPVQVHTPAKPPNRRKKGRDMHNHYIKSALVSLFFLTVLFALSSSMRAERNRPAKGALIPASAVSHHHSNDFENLASSVSLHRFPYQVHQ